MGDSTSFQLLLHKRFSFHAVFFFFHTSFLFCSIWFCFSAQWLTRSTIQIRLSRFDWLPWFPLVASEGFGTVHVLVMPSTNHCCFDIIFHIVLIRAAWYIVSASISRCVHPWLSHRRMQCLVYWSLYLYIILFSFSLLMHRHCVYTGRAPTARVCLHWTRQRDRCKSFELCVSTSLIERGISLLSGICHVVLCHPV